MNWHDYFEYRDGALFWRIKVARKVVVGSRAGSVQAQGKSGKYRRKIRLLGQRLMEHRVIWEMHFGPIPEGLQIGHRDGNPLNNEISNLRLATNSQNHENRREATGTHYCNSRRKWLAKIMVRGVPRTIGQYTSEAEARAAYLSTKRAVHEYCTT